MNYLVIFILKRIINTTIGAKGNWQERKLPHGRKSARDINREQIAHWFAQRLPVLDRHFGYSEGH